MSVILSRPAGGGASSSVPGTRLLYVDKMRVDDYVATGSSANPFKSIQAAIDAVPDNLPDLEGVSYTIVILPGVYEEIISIPEGVSLRGVDKRSCIVQSADDTPVTVDMRNVPIAFTKGNTVQDLTCKYLGSDVSKSGLCFAPYSGYLFNVRAEAPGAIGLFIAGGYVELNNVTGNGMTYGIKVEGCSLIFSDISAACMGDVDDYDLYVGVNTVLYYYPNYYYLQGRVYVDESSAYYPIASASGVYNDSSVTGLNVKDALNTLLNAPAPPPPPDPSLLNMPHLYATSHLVKSGTAPNMGRYITLQSFMFWNMSFVEVYKFVDGVPTLVDFGSLVGINTLDATRVRTMDGVEDIYPIDIVNAIGLENAGVEVGDTIWVNYYESSYLGPRVDLIPVGWDFDNNRPYGGTGVAWIDDTYPTPIEIWNKSMPVTCNGGMTRLTQINNFVVRDNVPWYLPTIYKFNNTTDKEVRFLFPNVLMDRNRAADYNFTTDSFRIEAYQFPQHQRRNPDATTKAVPFGKFNYLGCWYNNTMRLSRAFNIGVNCSYAVIGFRMRYLNTNQVSDWLPLKIYIKRRFRPQRDIPMDRPNESVWISFKY